MILIRLFFILFVLFLCKITLAELIKPNSQLLPEEVVLIQLIALQKNNIPYEDAGIEQTWEFAHPENRKFTGPLLKFISMMHTPSYALMLDHKKHNIILVKEYDTQSFFFVELITNQDVTVGFKWIVEKVLEEGGYKNCWMTTSVSQPMMLSKSI